MNKQARKEYAGMIINLYRNYNSTYAVDYAIGMCRIYPKLKEDIHDEFEHFFHECYLKTLADDYTSSNNGHGLNTYVGDDLTMYEDKLNHLRITNKYWNSGCSETGKFISDGIPVFFKKDISWYIDEF